LFKKITETFGEKVLLCYGHWNAKKQLPGLIPSPTVGIRKKLQDRFLSVDVPEWNTTVTCNGCGGRTVGMKRQKKEGSEETVSIHGLQQCTVCKTWLNRDRNAAKNIRNNFLYFQQHGKWDPKFMPKTKEKNCNNKMKRKRKEETKEKGSKKRKKAHTRSVQDDQTY
jgi:ssDNA-binding Zn-finger/Zn-ribbon topoisomerase 1